MSAPTPRPGRLVRSSAVLRGGQWWLVSEAGSIPVSDTTFASVLDGFAHVVAAADRAVAGLRARQSGPPASGAGGQR
ncbi:hypothetical protein OK006_3254 [Actinobacteria bacterium OK006]|nr:hypothetical protein OK006_3254 [Actinobacteria bacterium OK006]